MNRKLYTSIFAALALLALGLLTSCSSSSSTPTIAITATGGTPQTTTVGAAFTTALQATVTSNGSPAGSVSVTFTAPSSGASCTFSNGTATETDTASSGVATSSTCTANDTAGAFTVTAATSGTSSNASFSLTSTASAAATLAVGSGSGQSATIGAAFSSPLVANVVDQFNNPVSGVSVTFTAPASGASGTFGSNSTNTETDTTDANGNATSSTFTANSTVGGPYNVVATSGSLTAVNFTETNSAVSVTSANYVFYASGQEAINGGPNYYAVAGALTIDSLGNVSAGEEDYSDGFGVTSPNEPVPDTVTATNNPALVVDPSTGLGTLSITDTTLGLTQVFAVQFVNANHALITEFDGNATSSGSLDLQTATSISGNSSWAFTMSGVDPNYNSWDAGGVFTTNSTGASGTIDTNDAGTVTPGSNLTITVAGSSDTFGRTVVSLSIPAINVASYTVGPEVMRLIDIDEATVNAYYDAAIGSAYGQAPAGTTPSFGNGSLTAGVFAMIGQWSEVYATVGQFGTDGAGNITSGTADDNEQDYGVQPLPPLSISGTYSIAGSGYGSMTLSGDGDVSALGVYMVDPALNINDPNNTSADLGGALVADMDTVTALPGGMGVITPQTDTNPVDFTGNYAAGFQNINSFSFCCDYEFDMVGPFGVSSGTLATDSIGADDSDPFGTWTGTGALSTGDSFSSIPLVGGSGAVAGYFSMSQLNTVPNPLAATINTASGVLDADIYQASGTTLYWIEFDSNGMFIGPIEAQGSLTGMPAAKKPATKAQPKQAKSGLKGPVGQVRR